MTAFLIILGVVAFLLTATVITAYICYRRVFYFARPREEDPYAIPAGEIYEPYRKEMVGFIKEVEALPHRKVSLRSFDGLTLRGRYYEFVKGAPIEILFHGYRGSARKELSGGVIRCRALGHNVLTVDHRGSGESEGRAATFGILERRDALLWVELVLRDIDPDAKILISGISMGAATVLSCADAELPENVVGIVADCPYSSAREVIKKVMRDMHLPAHLLYPFVRLGGRLFGHFDPDEHSPMAAMKHSRVPVLFFHGDADAFVPAEMSEACHAACTSQSRLVITPGAGHGLCYPVDPEAYLAAIREFHGPRLY